jgi:hypothetical protein
MRSAAVQRAQIRFYLIGNSVNWILIHPVILKKGFFSIRGKNFAVLAEVGFADFLIAVQRELIP